VRECGFHENPKEEANAIVIYLDVYFLQNLILDFIVLSFTNKVCGYSAKFPRLLISATFGALWAVAVFTSAGNVRTILHICTYLPVACVMVWVISGTYRLKENIKGVVILYAVTFALSGILNMIAMYTSFGSIVTAKVMSEPQLVIYIFAAVLVVKSCIRAIVKLVRIDSYVALVEISTAGVTFRAKGLVDTGNHLCDPYSGKPVSIIDRRALPENIYIGRNEKMHYIPVNSVGSSNSVIQVFTAAECTVYLRNETFGLSNVLIGVSENNISTKGDYDMLVHPSLITRGDNNYDIKSSGRG
jgi:stage II sporulation protein GA (sporulation sigma-E factor processing peptidase)